MYFYGTHKLSLDDKNRMRIPAKLRAQLGENYCIISGSRKNLYIMPQSELDKLVEKFDAVPLSDIEAQAAIGDILGSAFVPEEDIQNRFILASHLKEYAKIDKKVVFVGVNKRIELIAEEIYDERNKPESDKIDIALSLLKKYGV